MTQWSHLFQCLLHAVRTKVHGGYALALRRNRGYLNQDCLVDLCEAPVTRYLVSRWELLFAANLIISSRLAYIDAWQVQGWMGPSVFISRIGRSAAV